MDGELMPYVQGQVKVPKEDRAVTRAAKGIYDTTRLAGFQVSAGMALAKHAMTEAKELDDHRRKLAGEDVVLNMALIQIEEAAVKGAANMVKKHTNPGGWNF